MRVVTPNRVVRGLVIQPSEFHELLPTRVCCEAFRIKDRPAPLVVGSVVRPSWAVAVEVSDQVWIVGQFGAMRSSNVVTPLLPILAAEVEVHGVLFPLMRFHEGE